MKLLLDTGSPNTILDSDVAARCGHDESRKAGVAHFLTLTGEIPGYTIRLGRLEALGRTLENYLIACHEFRKDLGIDGVLGFDFFKRARLTLDFRLRWLWLN